MSEWKIARKGKACGRCEHVFPAGEDFVSAIYLESGEGDEEGAAFSRLDACETCFAAEEREPFSRWVTRIPPKEEKRPPLDLGLAKEFLLRLLKERDPAHEKIALVLTLLLLRKRKLKLRGERGDGGVRAMELTIPTEAGEMDVTVPAPDVAPEEAAEITAELGRLFGLGEEEETGEKN